MTKLNKKEFKQLLTEWNAYINERSIKDFGNFTGMRDEQAKFVKTVPVGLNLYAVGDYYVDEKMSMPISYVLLESMKNSSYVFQEINKGLILEKSAINEMIEVLETILNNSNFTYKDRKNNLIKDEKIKENLIVNLKTMKSDLISLRSDKAGIMLYFPRMDSFVDDMADGSINKIGSITDEAVWKNSLSWELKHDVFHYFESILENSKSNSYKFLRNAFLQKNIYKILVSFVVPDQMLKSKDPSIRFGSSLNDGDHFATIVPYIRSRENNESNKKAFVNKCLKISNDKGITLSQNEINTLNDFFVNAHNCYDEIEVILQDKIVIQLAHG